MSCCDGWNYLSGLTKQQIEDLDRCPECGEYIDDDGDAMCGCFWSPIACKTCGSRPCDESC